MEESGVCGIIGGWIRQSFFQHKVGPNRPHSARVCPVEELYAACIAATTLLLKALSAGRTSTGIIGLSHVPLLTPSQKIELLRRIR